MPNWSNQLPDEARGHALPIRRTPARKPLKAIVTCEDLVGCYTHYWKGRTMPCEKPECDACDKGQPYRWHAYLSAWEPETALHFLFECTAQAAQNFVDFREKHHTLCGCYFMATRWKSSPNGRVLIRTKPDDVPGRRIPGPPDLIACLSTLWNIAQTEVGKSGYEPEKKTKIVTPFTPKVVPDDPAA